jgi:hypothetical protein
LEADYTLWAVSLMRPAQGQAPAVLENPVFTPELHRQGYIYGIFRRNE